MDKKEPAVKFLTDALGNGFLWVGLLLSVLSIVAYCAHLKKPSRKTLWLARLSYLGASVGVLGMASYLVQLIYSRKFQYEYVFKHTGTDVEGWYRIAATWSGQEGSFALWAAWTAVIGFLVIWKAGKYESRVMPFYISMLFFLCAILIKQTPFHIIPPPTAAELAANPGWMYPSPEGQGLTPSLQNYWMTIHPPTIFFGFVSLLVPFCYAIAALIWKDYKDWVGRVMPYALLSCATLGIGLFMGGYWAYETQGWHGFWAWDPVENASFFPWLAVTALAHGLVVQKTRGGMVRTNILLGILSYSLFLVGTFLTRSGALSQQDEKGNLISVHAFANIESTALVFLVIMLALYMGGGILLWLVRLKTMPVRPTFGDKPASRDLAMFVAVLLMMAACLTVTIGTLMPLFRTWMKLPVWQPKPEFYNKTLYPIALMAALGMGVAPWLAWRKTNTEKFLKKLLVPWLTMLVFGFIMVWWVQGSQREMEAIFDPRDTGQVETLRAWRDSYTLQRVAVVALAALGFFAALSNSILAFRIFRAKPLAAGGWLAHVGMGLLMLGCVVSNTYERTKYINLVETEDPQEAFGYKVAFEKMTGTVPETRPINPDYDQKNTVQLRITPPNVESVSAEDGSKTFLVEPRWFAHNISRAPEDKLERMIWPSIQKHLGYDLYLGFASHPQYIFRDPEGVTFKPGDIKKMGTYTVAYENAVVDPGKLIQARFLIADAQGKVTEATPGLEIIRGEGEGGMTMQPRRVAIPEIKDDKGMGVIYLDKVDAGSKSATVRISLPDYRGVWLVPLAVTFKPGINIVWLGVLVTGAGVLLAMFRRALEARKVADDVPDSEADWETAEESKAPLKQRVPATASAFEEEAPSEPKRRLKKAAKPQV